MKNSFANITLWLRILYIYTRQLEQILLSQELEDQIVVCGKLLSGDYKSFTSTRDNWNRVYFPKHQKTKW